VAKLLDRAKEFQAEAEEFQRKATIFMDVPARRGPPVMTL
jgi:hypothetical protein